MVHVSLGNNGDSYLPDFTTLTIHHAVVTSNDPHTYLLLARHCWNRSGWADPLDLADAPAKSLLWRWSVNMPKISSLLVPFQMQVTGSAGTHWFPISISHEAWDWRCNNAASEKPADLWLYCCLIFCCFVKSQNQWVGVHSHSVGFLQNALWLESPQADCLVTDVSKQERWCLSTLST